MRDLFKKIQNYFDLNKRVVSDNQEVISDEAEIPEWVLVLMMIFAACVIVYISLFVWI